MAIIVTFAALIAWVRAGTPDLLVATSSATANKLSIMKGVSKVEHTL
jgi:hypothetical protein